MFKKIAIIAFSMVLSNTDLLAQQSKKAGLLLDKPSFDKLMHKAPLSVRRTSPLPIKASLKEFAPPVTNQDLTNTCVGRSLAAALTIQEAQQRCLTSTTEIGKLFFSPAYIYGISRPTNTNDCEEAIKFETVLTAMQTKGIVRDHDVTDVCPSNEVIHELEKKAFKKSIPIFTTIFNVDSSGKTKLYLTKLALASKNPVVIGMSSEGAFSTKKGEESLWRLQETASAIGHAVCVVGYDKEKYGKGKGAFEIINSYGTEWGDKGYAWIREEDFEKYVYYGIEVPEMQQLPPIGVPQPEQPKPNPKKPDQPTNPAIVVVPPTPAPVPSNVSKPKPASPKKFVARVSLVHQEDTFKLAQVDMTKLVTEFGSKVRSRFRPIRVTKPVTTDDACQLLLDNDEATYVYVFSFDTRKAFDPLFPHPEYANMSPYLAAKNDITLPSATTEIVFDNHPGKEYICMLFSKTALDMAELKSKFDSETGDFFSRLDKILGKRLIAPDEDKIKDGLIEAILNLNPEQTIVPVIIEFNHI